MLDRCYMCSSEATTREHAPPRSFFPPGLREGMVTVPSCPRHNNDNSDDVEYVRNAIVGSYPVNEVGLSLLPKAQRSFDRSPALFARTFREWWPVLTPQGESFVFRLDMTRFNLVMVAIAYALYYKDEGKQYGGEWRIFSPSLSSEKALLGNRIDDWEVLRRMLTAVRFSPRRTTQPRVFKYWGYRESDSKLVYKFDFYEGFTVNALTLPGDFSLRTGEASRDSQTSETVNL